jgi:alkylation response protein AidB-like acyl-CoA dehydrogenase
MAGFFARHSPLSTQRRPPGEIAPLPDYWAEFAKLDLLGFELAESGTAVTPLVQVIPLYLEMGRALACSPHLESAVIATHAISALDPGADVLSELSGGATVVVPALRDGSGDWVDVDAGVTATPAADGWRLDGECALVCFAHVADRLLVPAATPDGVCLFLVAGDARGVAMSYSANVADLPLFAVRFKAVAVGPDERLGDARASAAALDSATDRAAVLRCAEVAGAGDRLLQMCLDYAHIREQFGQPIGSYQAVQYLCTDIAIDSRVTLLLAAQAADLIDRGQSADAAVAAARRYARRTATAMVRAAQELFAGVGFMAEHDLHLFTRRSRFWVTELDDARHGTSRLLAPFGVVIDGGATAWS